MGTNHVRSYQARFAAEVRAEAGRQRLSLAELGRRAGVPHSTWRKHFVTHESDVTLAEMYAVATVLGLSVEELLRRAGPVEADSRAALEAGLSDKERAQVDEAARKRRKPKGRPRQADGRHSA